MCQSPLLKHPPYRLIGRSQVDRFADSLVRDDMVRLEEPDNVVFFFRGNDMRAAASFLALAGLAGLLFLDRVLHC